jgi:hypothetical protein
MRVVVGDSPSLAAMCIVWSAQANDVPPTDGATAETDAPSLSDPVGSVP